jgi:hypothetical protein
VYKRVERRKRGKEKRRDKEEGGRRGEDVRRRWMGGVENIQEERVIHWTKCPRDTKSKNKLLGTHNLGTDRHITIQGEDLVTKATTSCEPWHILYRITTNNKWEY